MNSNPTNRRGFLQTAGAALTTSIFTGNVRGANDRLAGAFIGTGVMGRGDLDSCLHQQGVEVKWVCDVYQPNLEKAIQATGGKARGTRDFRQVLEDKSVDFVCIATPDHWHAYITVEACKAGKDVYVEKPACHSIDEGVKMVQAARKYKRVVQAGTMQRSGLHFQQAVEIVRSGVLGKVTMVRSWNCERRPAEGCGNPPDGRPPETLDWDRWLGPAPARPFNPNRFGVHEKGFSTFRWFWDYAGGMMTDWGVHLLDIVQMAFGEAMPSRVTALGGKYWLTDNTETPDTLQVVYEYPNGMISTYEDRNNNAQAFLGPGQTYGTSFHGEHATLFVNRGSYRLLPENPKNNDLKETEVKNMNNSGYAHWEDFLHCIRTREKPRSEIETCQRSTTTCLLGNVALRTGLRLDFDEKQWTTVQPDARRLLTREPREPWKITV